MESLWIVPSIGSGNSVSDGRVRHDGIFFLLLRILTQVIKPGVTGVNLRLVRPELRLLLSDEHQTFSFLSWQIQISDWVSVLSWIRASLQDFKFGLHLLGSLLVAHVLYSSLFNLAVQDFFVSGDPLFDKFSVSEGVTSRNSLDAVSTSLIIGRSEVWGVIDLVSGYPWSSKLLLLNLIFIHRWLIVQIGRVYSVLGFFHVLHDLHVLHPYRTKVDSSEDWRSPSSEVLVLNKRSVIVLSVLGSSCGIVRSEHRLHFLQLTYLLVLHWVVDSLDVFLVDYLHYAPVCLPLLVELRVQLWIVSSRALLPRYL